MLSSEITLKFLEQYSNKDSFKIICPYCGKYFERDKKYLKNNLTRNRSILCSLSCSTKFRNIRLGYGAKTIYCENCNQSFAKHNSQIKKTKHNFCSNSCACSFANKNKTYGQKRSKLEIFIEKQLCEQYDFEILFNNKKIINSELDIFVPSLMLAFELNGIFHYEPIFGQDKLNYIKNNDDRKLQACLEKQIELCIIDSSGFKYFKPDKAIAYFEIIKNIIDSKLLSNNRIK